MSTDPHVLADRRHALETAFFARHEQELVERFRARVAEQERHDQLAEAAGISDEAVLQHLLERGIDGKSLAALAFVPLVAVAWADRRLDVPERRALLQAASDRGLAESAEAKALLEEWLTHAPDPQILSLWKEYVGALAPSLPAEAREKLKNDLLGAARGIAEAAGGFLGLGNKVSDEEQAVLDDLERAFEA
jgi:hypothetical protein